MSDKINNIEEWRDDIIDTMKTLFKQDGFLTPVVLFVEQKVNEPEKGLDMGIIPINDLLKDQDTKDKLHDVVVHMCTEKDIVALMFITEAWMVSKEKGDEEADFTSIIPSESKDKVEGDIPTLENERSAASLGGRFSHLLSHSICYN